MEKFILRVPGMMCMHCVGSIKSALESMEGISEVDVVLAEKSVSFVADPAMKQKVIDAIDDLGFDVE